MESVPHLDIDLLGFSSGSREGLAVVKVDAAVGDIQCSQRAETRSPKSLPSERSNVVCCGKCVQDKVARERVTEAGAVINVGGCVGAPRERNIGADVERVGLIVVESEERGRRRKIRQAPVMAVYLRRLDWSRRDGFVRGGRCGASAESVPAAGF